MSAEGKILAAEFTAAVLVISSYIIYAGSREGNNPSLAGGTPDPNDGRPALTSTGLEQSDSGNAAQAAQSYQDNSSRNMARTEPNSKGSTYKIVAHPEGKNGDCRELEKTTPQNPQTVFGAAESINNPKIYIDVNTFDVYTLNPDGTHTKIGSFSSSSMPGSQYNLVPIGTDVCEGVE